MVEVDGADPTVESESSAQLEEMARTTSQRSKHSTQLGRPCQNLNDHQTQATIKLVDYKQRYLNMHHMSNAT